MAESMSASEARQFDGISLRNAEKVVAALAERGRAGCTCQPYVDVFTYRRWIAQGMQVQKGEKGIRIPVVKVVESRDATTGELERKRLLRTSSVFCRCQCKPSGSREVAA